MDIFNDESSTPQEPAMPPGLRARLLQYAQALQTLKAGREGGMSNISLGQERADSASSHNALQRLQEALKQKGGQQ